MIQKVDKRRGIFLIGIHSLTELHLMFQLLNQKLTKRGFMSNDDVFLIAVLMILSWGKKNH